MAGLQLDLFAEAGCRAESVSPRRPELVPDALDDEALIGAMATANLATTAALAAEAARRRLGAAVPALESLCRRFAGFGVERVVPEQAAALAALAEIGGTEAACAVVRSIVRGIVQGPTLVPALAAAGRLGGRLPAQSLRALMRHDNPAIRADACRCAVPHQGLAEDLVARLDDMTAGVARAAALALGQMGRPEGRPLLLHLLRSEPSAAVIEAVAPVADAECLVLLGRIARTVPALADAAFDVLDDSDAPRARIIATAARQHGPTPETSRSSNP
jgi:hypothetical protein